MRKLALSLIAASTLAAMPLTASAQSYPEDGQPIRIIVPYAPGGSSDFMARLFARKLSENMNHSFVVENKPGGNTIIGADYVAKSKSDGYTLYLIGELTHGSLRTLNAKLPFDPAKDFAGVSNLIESPLVISVPPQFPAANLKEFVAYAQAHPGQVNYGSAGTGNTLHLAGEQFSQVAKVQMNHVQYKGASQAVLDLLAGRIQVMFDLPQTPLPHIQSGALKALAVTSRTRLPMLAQVPTTQEAGYPDYAFTTRVGIAAPAGTPGTILNRLNAEIRKAAQDPAVQQALEKQAMLVATSATPQEHQQRLAAGMKMVSELLAGTRPAQ
ncbi:Bug family tripartite tricarboxylate transporter substrate binding protein [Xylophilus sp. ASV27]|uniref:Bug family tripartite tricarboxylate transporter substrate binding protein n=1 Tax=Xylophilus sp. ASV27 TaxID=2795129 RepID=UPI0018EC4802|nr:tripartite tricarboxylate transporter substrate binding protein [Xylophilus sp. ASV27]